MPMDDRLARLLLEDNILSVQKRDSGRIALLEKLATVKSLDLQTLPVPGALDPLPAPNSNALNWQSVFLFDDFISGDTTNGVVGDLYWSKSANVTVDAVPTSSASHPGVLLVSAAAAGKATLFLAASGNEATYPLLIGSTLFSQFIVTADLGGDVDDFIVFGLIDGGFNTSGLGSEGIFFSVEDGQANWQTYTTDGIGTTQNDTGIPYISAAWVMLEIKKIDNGFSFYINNILVATHTTNVSTTQTLSPTAGVSIGAGSSGCSIEFDYFALQFVSIVQRWD